MPAKGKAQVKAKAKLVKGWENALVYATNDGSPHAVRLAFPHYLKLPLLLPHLANKGWLIAKDAASSNVASLKKHGLGASYIETAYTDDHKLSEVVIYDPQLDFL
jgi:hypothetical protein